MKAIVWQLCLVLLAACFTVSCDRNVVYQDITSLSEGAWAYNDTIGFQVEVEEPMDSLLFSVYLRHTADYAWRNCWVRMFSVNPEGDTAFARYNLRLSQPSGQWYGRCRGDNCESLQPLVFPLSLNQVGDYSFYLTQDMRSNPLEEVTGVGIRIEKGLPDELR